MIILNKLTIKIVNLQNLKLKMMKLLNNCLKKHFTMKKEWMSCNKQLSLFNKPETQLNKNDNNIYISQIIIIIMKLIIYLLVLVLIA